MPPWPCHLRPLHVSAPLSLRWHPWAHQTHWQHSCVIFNTQNRGAVALTFDLSEDHRGDKTFMWYLLILHKKKKISFCFVSLMNLTSPITAGHCNQGNKELTWLFSLAAYETGSVWLNLTKRNIIVRKNKASSMQHTMRLRKCGAVSFLHTQYWAVVKMYPNMSIFIVLPVFWE